MRVLHFLPVYVPAWQYGGPILSVSRLCEGLVRHGVEVRVITTNAGLSDYPLNQLGVKQIVNGVEVFYYKADQTNGYIRSSSLLDSLAQHLIWADIIHISSIWQPLGIPIQRAASDHGVPVFQTLRGALSPYSWMHGTYKKIPYYFLRERPLLQRAAAIQCTTKQEQREVDWLKLFPPIKLLPNPLDLSGFSVDNDLRRKWRADHNIPPSSPVFVIAGRIHHKKGLDLLPNVLSKFVDIPWHLLIIGNDEDGSQHSLLKSFDSYDLLRRCHCFPSIPSSQLQGPLNASDWLLLPSRHENFGNIVIEALSCGCGAILSSNVGVAEMLSSCPGVLCGPRHLSSWINMIGNSIQMTRPAESAENWVKLRFGQDVIAQKAVEIYTDILSNG